MNKELLKKLALHYLRTDDTLICINQFESEGTQYVQFSLGNRDDVIVYLNDSEGIWDFVS